MTYSEQTTNIVALCDMLRDSARPRRSIRVASPAEIAHTRANLALCFMLFRSCIEGYLKRLNENLPITETVQYCDLLGAVIDIQSDIDGRVMKLEGE